MTIEEGHVNNINSSKEFEDEDHTIFCEWWCKDKKYGRWFNPDDLKLTEEKIED